MISISAHDLRGAALIAGAFFALLILAEVWTRVGNPKPEWTRKLVHLGGGLIGLALPLLIDSPAVVFVLTASLSGIFLIGEKTKLMRSLHRVERKSRGSEYYPLAIFLVFAIAADRYWLYLSAVLVLATADAFAALVGSKYGVVRYEVEDEYKSVEGSLVFFIVAFLAIHLPMLLMTALPRSVCVLAALLVALLVTLFEAISLRGTDNLFVPVAVVFVLQKITTKPLAEIAFQNLSLIGILLVIAFLSYRLHWFNTGGALTVALFTYATWSLGPRMRWAEPVFIALAVLVTARLILASRIGPPMKVRVISRALLVPFLFLLIANLTDRFDFFFGPYLAACAATLSFVIWNSGIRMRIFTGWNRPAVAVTIGALSAAVVTVPMAFLYGHATWPAVATVVALVALASLFNTLLFTRANMQWSATPFLLATLTGAVLLAMQALLLVQPWLSFDGSPMFS
jgi:phytol kinase